MIKSEDALSMKWCLKIGLREKVFEGRGEGEGVSETIH